LSVCKFYNINSNSKEIKANKQEGNMLNLAFDTTARSCSVALSRDSIIIGKKIEKMDFGQAEALFPIIQNILKKQNIIAKDLNLVTVCTGPGSFTGVRSSLAAARSLGLALHNIQIMGVSAFETYLESLEESELADINAVIIETKREDFYFQSFNKNREKIAPPEALEYEEIINKLRHKKVTLIGDGVERFLYKPSGLSLHAIRMEEFAPIEILALCGDNKFKNKNIDYPKPLYLHTPDVCVKYL
jgi:tRNA threonylcarbamoyladenosine biosynthesis protein TsaB